MKFKYFGTAAAEGWPTLFCKCPACARARAAGGRNIRTRSQALIDDRLLIDFPADTYMHVLYQGLDLASVSTCIITHDHSDHLYAADFEMRRQGFAYFSPERLLTVYGTQPAEAKVQSIIDRYDMTAQGRVAFQRVTPFEPFSADGYTMTPLRADHDPRCDPVIYLISDGAKNILYANDTGYFLAETWEYLERHHPHLDFISLDCTTGLKPCGNNHMGLEMVAKVKHRLAQIGCVDDQTTCCVNHFSHNGLATYDEMVPLAAQRGFLVSYDGMTLEL
jgi:phosphoribosyl 1,2-cyclic phosphate phosphodiesterase